MDIQRQLTRPAVCLATGLVAGVTAFALSGNRYHEETRALLGWCVGAGIWLAIILNMMLKASPEETRRRAMEMSPNPTLTLLTVVLATLCSTAAVSIMLNNSKAWSHWENKLHLALSIASVFLSWLLTHTRFALDYARLHYHFRAADSGQGLNFPDEGEHLYDYVDFTYFAFTIGMCFQTSDISLNSRRLRRLVLLHSFVSFMFYTFIISIIVNSISNLL
jgi:uncharacterized membrane protein